MTRRWPVLLVFIALADGTAKGTRWKPPVRVADLIGEPLQRLSPERKCSRSIAAAASLPNLGDGGTQRCPRHCGIRHHDDIYGLSLIQHDAYIAAETDYPEGWGMQHSSHLLTKASTMAGFLEEEKSRRRDDVLRSIMFVWGNYALSAFGAPETDPRTGKASKGEWHGEPQFIFDNMDALWMAGLKEEVWRTARWMETGTALEEIVDNRSDYVDFRSRYLQEILNVTMSTQPGHAAFAPGAVTEWMISPESRTRLLPVVRGLLQAKSLYFDGGVAHDRQKISLLDDKILNFFAAFPDRSPTLARSIDVSTFETTIRTLGGMLSAFFLTSHPIFLFKAWDVGLRLSESFFSASLLDVDEHQSDKDLLFARVVRPRHLDFERYNRWRARMPKNRNSLLAWTKGYDNQRSQLQSCPAEMASLQMEFSTLAEASQTCPFFDLAEANFELMVLATDYLRTGILPVSLFQDVSSPEIREGNTYSLGSMVDSAFEYMLKNWLLTGQRDELRRTSIQQHLRTLPMFLSSGVLRTRTFSEQGAKTMKRNAMRAWTTASMHLKLGAEANEPADLSVGLPLNLTSLLLNWNSSLPSVSNDWTNVDSLLSAGFESSAPLDLEGSPLEMASQRVSDIADQESFGETGTVGGGLSHRSELTLLVNLGRTVSASPSSSQAAVTQWGVMRTQEHLSCFLAGHLALALQRPPTAEEVARNSSIFSKAWLSPAQYLAVAESLASGCVATYFFTRSGLGPERVKYSPPDDVMKVADSRSLIRPETLESLALLHHLTKKVKYSNYGWRIFMAFEKWSRVKKGYCSVSNVNELPPGFAQCRQDTWLLAETFKYLQLLFTKGPDVEGKVIRPVFPPDRVTRAAQRTVQTQSRSRPEALPTKTEFFALLNNLNLSLSVPALSERMQVPGTKASEEFVSLSDSAPISDFFRAEMPRWAVSHDEEEDVCKFPLVSYVLTTEAHPLPTRSFGVCEGGLGSVVWPPVGQS